MSEQHLGRRAAIIGLGATLALATVAVPAFGKPAHPGARGKGHPSTTTTTAVGTSATPAATVGTTASSNAHARRDARFQYVGTVKAVDVTASSLTITVKGGNKRKARGTAVTIKVASTTRIKRNGKRVKLADLRVGDHAQAKGTNGTASDVHAEGRRGPTPSTSTTSPSSTSTTVPVSSTTSTTTGVTSTTSTTTTPTTVP